MTNFHKYIKLISAKSPNSSELLQIDEGVDSMLTWMGRYQPLVEAIIRHTNIYSRFSTNKPITFEGIQLSVTGWQILEYIYEHEKDDMRMIYLSERLCIPQSSFSKQIKILDEYGLIDRYQHVGNKKNIIVKPSPKGRKLYEEYAASFTKEFWHSFFDALEPVSDDALQTFVDALEQLNRSLLNDNSPDVLVKLEPKRHVPPDEPSSRKP